MGHQLLLKFIASLFFIFSSLHLFSSKENFLLINGKTEEIVYEFGPHINEPVTPCSTFKIFLSLIGFNEGILVDKTCPVWPYEEGYVHFLESWKYPQTPESWMKNSCVWYSQLLTQELGLKKIQNYLETLDYGNQDMTGGLTSAWLSSTLKISPKQQVRCIQKLVQESLPISRHAIKMTKQILFVEELPEGGKLFGKTGMGTIFSDEGEELAIGWFVGWVEKDHNDYPFAYTICDKKVDPAMRIPRVKELVKSVKLYQN